MKNLTFHSNFARVTVCVNGVPYSLNAEVDITLKRPTKLDGPSCKAWDAINKTDDVAVTAELIPGGIGNGD